MQLHETVKEVGTDKIIANAMGVITTLTEVKMPAAECVELQRCLIGMLQIRKCIEGKADEPADATLQRIATIVSIITGPIVVDAPQEGENQEGEAKEA